MVVDGDGDTEEGGGEDGAVERGTEVWTTGKAEVMTWVLEA